jgi:ArsR family metal-binding transcriptional regulator
VTRVYLHTLDSIDSDQCHRARHNHRSLYLRTLCRYFFDDLHKQAPQSRLTSGTLLCLSLDMASVVVFPDKNSFSSALAISRDLGIHVEPLAIPKFCSGIAPPAMLTTANLKRLIDNFESHGITLSGVIPHKPFKRDIPEAPPPDPQWHEIVGGITLSNIRLSLTDPLRLTVEVTPGNSLEYLIPIMARLIRGGAYRPEDRILAFEEEHRLIAFLSESVVISRVDDLLDAWIMLRCSVDLICSAWERRHSLDPDANPRHGIGPIEIFRRLPGNNCGKCRHGDCMEFAVQVFTGQQQLRECPPLLEEQHRRNLESVTWLARVIGLR